MSGVVGNSLFPTIAIDPLGKVNVIWGVTGASGDLIFYSRWDGEVWSRPTDVLLGGPRTSVAIDNSGQIHLLYLNNGITYVQASIDKAGTAKGWSPPRRFGTTAASVSDMVIDNEGTIHVVWAQQDKGCAACYSVMYKMSTDAGETWSKEVKLSTLPIDRRHIQIKLDPRGNLYVTWDNLSAKGANPSAGYTSSTDGGKTWVAPKEFFSPRGTPVQTVVGADGQGMVVMVWRATGRDEIYYQFSTDRGLNWTKPAVIPGLMPSRPATGTDRYDMATDSAGTIHMVVAARITNEQDIPGLYHLQWDGKSWGAPQAIYDNADFPEYPTLVVSEGNRLHVTWSTRGRDSILESPDDTYQVWYSSLDTSAPSVPLAPTLLPRIQNTPTPRPSSPTPSPTATATPFRPSVSTSSEGDTTNPQLVLVFSLAPVVLIIGIVIAVTAFRRSR